MKKTCEKCKAISKESAKFCHDCGAPLDSSEEKFVIKEDDSPIDVGEIVGEVTKSRVAKVGLVILVATLVLILVLNGLPVAKATNNEEKYSAYYNYDFIIYQDALSMPFKAPLKKLSHCCVAQQTLKIIYI